MLKYILLIACLVFSVCPAGAQQLSGTLQKIKNSNIVIMGHRESSVPFSYYDMQQNVIGYAQDYSNLIVQALKQKLNLPDLRVKYIPITSQNRIPLLQNGTYDFECGSTTNNRERQKQVDFSNTFFITGAQLLVHKDSGINDFNDLYDKNVAVTFGTTSEIELNRLNDRENLKMRIISAQDHGDAMRMLETGRAVAFFIDDVLLAGEKAKARHPDEWVIVGTPLAYEAYGCMLRRGDKQFKQLLDEVIAQAQTSGVAREFYEKWFTGPIPPNGLNLKFELSDELRGTCRASGEPSAKKECHAEPGAVCKAGKPGVSIHVLTACMPEPAEEKWYATQGARLKGW